MAWILELGSSAFLIQKTFVVGLWLLLLVVHKNFRLARLGLWALAGIYSLLILYHLALIGSSIDPREGGVLRDEIGSEQPGDQSWHGGLDAQQPAWPWWPGMKGTRPSCVPRPCTARSTCTRPMVVWCPNWPRVTTSAASCR